MDPYRWNLYRRLILFQSMESLLYRLLEALLNERNGMRGESMSTARYLAEKERSFFLLIVKLSSIPKHFEDGRR